jgi:endonuclease III
MVDRFEKSRGELRLQICQSASTGIDSRSGQVGIRKERILQTDFQWYVGIDWASKKHRVYCMDPQGKMLGHRWIDHDGNGLIELVNWLRGFCGDHPGQLAVGIEVPHGALVETLVEQRFAVFSINPKQLDRFRDRYSPAGAKDDERDAMVLADSLRTDRHCFRAVRLGPADILRLRELSRLEESLGRERQRIENQLWDLARRYYPQLLRLAACPNEPWLWDLWEAAPLPAQGARLSLSKITRILKQHRIRRVDAAAVHQILASPALRLAPGAAEAASEHALVLLPLVRVLHRQEAQVIQRIAALLEELAAGEGENNEHRDAAILLSLPGVGRKVAATVLSEGYQAIADRDYHGFRVQGGAAPVTRNSGKKTAVVMRYACNERLRNALHHWAFGSMLRDPRSTQQYQQMRARKQTHSRALRGLGDRLTDVLFSMLRHRAVFDPKRRAA